MNYDLAKALKDAGFPLIRPWCKNIDNRLPVGHPCDGLPTLSELIEACGDEYRNLMRQPEEQQTIWLATSQIEFNDLGSITPPKYEGAGSTPEEAVARLWLALKDTK